jgi:hypothetical protein
VWLDGVNYKHTSGLVFDARRSAKKASALTVYQRFAAPTASAPMATAGMRAGGNSNSCRRKSRIVVLIKPGRPAGEVGPSRSRSCLAALGELGGANARPNAEALGKANQEKAGLMRLGQRSIKSRMSALGH